MLRNRFNSLRFRLLVPILLVSLLAATGVAIGSSLIGNHWGTLDLHRRSAGMERALNENSFPLNQNVLRALADLTQASLVTVRNQIVVNTTLDERDYNDRARIQDVMETSANSQSAIVELAGGRYIVRPIKLGRGRPDSDGVTSLLMLFDESELREFRWRAALLPMVTGISTVVLLTSVTLYLTSHLINRLALLQQQVDAVGTGNFETTRIDPLSDEVGMLSASVASMATQLKQLWSTVNRQQSEKLIHQIAGGLAHQLRNSLTGARMAVELHVRHCQSMKTMEQKQDLQVALHQLDSTEDYVKRLLLLAKGSQQQEQAARIGDCLEGIRSSLALIAKHRHLNFDWRMVANISSDTVADGPTLAAAVNNLVLNAFDAGTSIVVELTEVSPGKLRVDVTDDGDGPPASLASSMFDPFVTSKPEGLGLGLPLVRRAVEKLAGELEWSRMEGKTLFRISIQLHTPLLQV